MNLLRFFGNFNEGEDGADDVRNQAAVESAPSQVYLVPKLDPVFPNTAISLDIAKGEGHSPRQKASRAAKLKHLLARGDTGMDDKNPPFFL